MTKLFTLGLLAALGLSVAATDAQAFGRRNKGCSSGPAYSNYSSGCGGCGSSYGGGYPSNSYGGYRADAGFSGGIYYAQGQNVMTGNPAMGAPGMAMPMPPASTPTTGALTTGAAAAGQPGMVTVKLPTADAEVWFEGAKYPGTGKERTFNTHPLADGKPGEFKVKAKWIGDDGKVMEKTLPVSVKAGQTSTVDFK